MHAVRGIHSAQPNPLTGSILVLHDPTACSPADIATTVRVALGFAHERSAGAAHEESVVHAAEERIRGLVIPRI
jgi:hypothetical protein